MGKELFVPLGPVDDFPVIDDFTYEEVRENHCVATVAKEVSRYLIEKAELEGKKYLPICLPCYNEDFHELLKTLVSLMENFEFMQRKTRLHDDGAGKSLEREFMSTVPIICPIFDGQKALSKSMKDWLTANFPLLLNEMEGKSEPGKIDVRICCSRWWYYCEDTLPPEPGVPTNQVARKPSTAPALHRSMNMDGVYGTLEDGRSPLDDEDKILYFYMCPIVKRENHRKHNSHQWFFDSICEGLEDKCTYAFLTDCGTSYETTCISKLLYDIYFKTDLIGVTARQRVETPDNFFHPCEDSPFWLLQGDHTGKDPKPCWKCWACFLLSPCPLQGFEFEATLILNSAMFNLVEALPVMPGPCQLLHWQKMREFKVVDEYFNLLFEGEAQKKLPKLRRGLKRMKNSVTDVVKDDDLTVTTIGEKISFTEFLRVNMRLAEDRILSFVCVFSTGYGTKWVPGATFFYQPEVRWTTLLTQRRRWLNGTFASFLFFFMSERARNRINGGMFDQHKAGKNIRFVNALWSLQLVQLALVIICPAVFGSASYIALVESAKLWHEGFGWSQYKLYELNDLNYISVAECWLCGFFVVYAIWTVMSYFAPRGKMSETLCRVLSICGFLFMMPVYFAIWYFIITQGLDVVGGLVVCGLFAPFLVALGESATSAGLYLLYLPWFMVLIVFFLVFVPGYSFARLWDTTWGNRATGKDSAINEHAERTMKFRNVLFSTFLIIFNIIIVFCFIRLFKVSYTAVIAFMFIVFFPLIIQLACAIIFLFVALPLRNAYGRPDEKTLYLAAHSGHSIHESLQSRSHSFSEYEINDINDMDKHSVRSRGNSFDKHSVNGGMGMGMGGGLNRSGSFENRSRSGSNNNLNAMNHNNRSFYEQNNEIPRNKYSSNALNKYSNHGDGSFVREEMITIPSSENSSLTTDPIDHRLSV